MLSTLLIGATGCDGCELRLQPYDGELGGAVETTSGTSGTELSTADAEDPGAASSSDSSGVEATTGVAKTTGAAETTAAPETAGESDLCGNGVVDEGEVCDDGNAVDEDECPSGEFGSCRAWGHCGDGILVWPEACDDGDLQDEDGCPSGPIGRCEALANCGDGIVRMDGEAEECDDGNVEDGDACLSNCEAAKCGDGVVWTDVEQCDEGDEFAFDKCDDTCKFTRHVFVSSAVFAGNLGGISGADTLCGDLAEPAGLHGEYKAWLSDGYLEPNDWGVSNFSGWYVTPCSTAVAQGWNFAYEGGRINCDEHGEPVEAGEPVWTNVTPNGSAYPFIFESCDGWVADSSLMGRVGYVGGADEQWTMASSKKCNGSAHLYCFQVAD